MSAAQACTLQARAMCRLAPFRMRGDPGRRLWLFVLWNECGTFNRANEYCQSNANESEEYGNCNLKQQWRSHAELLGYHVPNAPRKWGDKQSDSWAALGDTSHTLIALPPNASKQATIVGWWTVDAGSAIVDHIWCSSIWVPNLSSTISTRDPGRTN